MPLKTWGRAKFHCGFKPGDRVFNTNYPTVELKMKSHIMEQFERWRQSALAQLSPLSLSLCLWIHSHLTRFEHLNRSPTPHTHAHRHISTSAPHPSCFSLASLEGYEKGECTSETWLCFVNLWPTWEELPRWWCCSRGDKQWGKGALHTDNSTVTKQCKKLHSCEHKKVKMMFQTPRYLTADSIVKS